MKKSVAIVASTLPIALLRRRAEALGVDSIIATSARLGRSFSYLNHAGGQQIKIRAAPSSFLGQSMYFAALVTWVKLTGRRLLIFHECCLPALDLVILLLRPVGDHFPQVSMQGSIAVDISDVPKSKILELLRMLGLSRFFQIYHSPPVGNNPPEYVMSIKAYPRGIKSHPLSYETEAGRSARSSHSRSILLLVGKSFAKDEEQLAIFSSIVAIADRHGYRCEIKDHPNPAFRLGFRDIQARAIDPEMPSELLDDDYAVVIGAQSTGLLRYGPRAFSIVEMLESVSADDIELARRHYDEAAPGHQLRYLASLEQLETILKGTP